MQLLVAEAEARAQKAEADKQKAEAEKQKAEAEAQQVLRDAAIRMLETMDKDTVAKFLGLELAIVNQLETVMSN